MVTMTRPWLLVSALGEQGGEPIVKTAAHSIRQRIEPLADQRTGASRYFFVALGTFYD